MLRSALKVSADSMQLSRHLKVSFKLRKLGHALTVSQLCCCISKDVQKWTSLLVELHSSLQVDEHAVRRSRPCPITQLMQKSTLCSSLLGRVFADGQLINSQSPAKALPSSDEHSSSYQHAVLNSTNANTSHISRLHFKANQAGLSSLATVCR